MGDGAAAYCPGDDTIYISEQFAAHLHGALTALPAASGTRSGTSRSPSSSRTSTATRSSTSSASSSAGCRRSTSSSRPTASPAPGPGAPRDRLEDGDIEEALNTALSVGDYQTGAAGHHGTPEQRKEAWTRGFEAGDPSA